MLTAHPDRLFDEGVRTDPQPGYYGEDTFTFLNRVDQPFWARIRAELERWFAALPRTHADDLRGRFRKRVAAQHLGAWWELYLHRLFTRLGFEIQVHPDLPDAKGHPDFRLIRGDDCFLLEAAATFSGIVDDDRDAERENWIMAAIDRAQNANFHVRLEIAQGGTERPSVAEIVRRLEAWLEGLDPDAVIAGGPDAYPVRPLDVRDWSLRLTALPVKPEARGLPSGRLLGMPPSSVGFVNDVEMLHSTLTRKRRQSGGPQEPLVIAVLLSSPTFDNEDIEQALLGRVAVQFDPSKPGDGRWVRQRNGFWMPGSRPRGTRVSAVLTGTNLMPYNVTSVWPRLWPNPWAARPLSVELPFPTAVADTNGSVQYTDAAESPAELVGLAEGWPGPDAPFSKEWTVPRRS